MKKESSWLLKEKYQGVESEAFHADCARLKNGEPLAYVIGHTPFLNCTIHLDSRPLIPRPETEYWTNRFIKTQQTENPNKPLHILDLCAGSGCIGVAVGNYLTKTTVDFAELDTGHIPTIEKNCQANDITDQRYQIYTSDLFANIPRDTVYDHIVSNPPYIDPTVDRTETSVRIYEPKTALYGGTFGMEYIARILHVAPQHLKPSGSLWIEHEPEHTKAIATLAKPNFARTRTYQDQYNIARFSVCTMAQ